MLKRHTNLFFTTAIFAVLTLISGGCAKQEASKAVASETSVAAVSNPADAELAAAQKSIEKSPDTAAGYNKVAVLYMHRARETGDFDLNSKAEAAINHALEVEPNDYDAQKLRASLLLTFHRFAEGLEAGKMLQKEHPQDAFIYGVLTDANVELGNYAEAIDAAQKMVDLRPNMESYARVSYVRSLHGDSRGAIEAMSLAARIADPMDKEAQAWCLVHLGDEYFKIGQIENAEKQFDAALKIFPNYHFAVAAKGKARAAAGDFDAAIKFYTQAQERVPLTETVIQLGDVYSKTGNREQAQKQYDLAVFIEEKFGNIDRRRLAQLWADQNTKLDEALEIARSEHDKRKDIFTADVYAWCLYKKGQFDEAKQIINEAMRLKTNDARIFYHAGMIEKDSGNKKAAIDLLNLSIKTNSSFDVLQAEAAKSMLQELR